MTSLCTIALAEPGASAAVFAVFGTLIIFSVLFMKSLVRAGVPVVLAFLVLGMIGGSEGIGGIQLDDYGLAFRLGTAALILILFEGGLNTSWRAVRAAAGPSGVLATLGVVFTAAGVAACGRLFGLTWTEALLVGAIVSSTDAAAVFAVLRGGGPVRLRRRSRSIIEVESCLNDPMAVILTVGVVEWAISGSPPGLLTLALLAWQLAAGGAIGVLLGALGSRLLIRVPIQTAGLFPAVTISLAMVSFGLATLAGASGFLSVFATAVVMGNTAIPYRAGFARVHDAVAWLCQASMFMMLGLLVFPSRLLPVAGVGLGLGLTLAVVVRPLVVAACLMPFRIPPREAFYIGWVGLRGAVPIILGTIPALAGLPEGDRIFHIVFFVVVLSTIVPGSSILPIARWLGLLERHRPEPAAAIELHSLRNLDGSIRHFAIDSTLAVCGAKLSEIPFPEGAGAVLVARGNQLLAARGSTRLLEGDDLYVFCRRSEDPLLTLLFGAAQE